MPIYEFKCSDCENEFEVLSLSSGEMKEKIVCNKCQSVKVSKIISAGSIRTGSGNPLATTPPAGCGGNSGFS